MYLKISDFQGWLLDVNLGVEYRDLETLRHGVGLQRLVRVRRGARQQ